MTFHHHRIGLHETGPGTGISSREAATLVPLFSGVSYSERDQKRNLGLAYIALSQRDEGQEHARQYVNQGVALLRECWKAGLREVELARNLANRGLKYAFGITGSGLSLSLITELERLGVHYYSVSHEASGA